MLVPTNVIKLIANTIINGGNVLLSAHGVCDYIYIGKIDFYQRTSIKQQGTLIVITLHPIL